MINGLAQIQEFVVRFEGRGPGTDAERRAAGYLAQRLEGLGRESKTESAWVNPQYQLAHLLHALLAVLASIISIASPRAGLVLAAIAAASAIGDLSGRLYLARRLTPKRATQSVVSREQGGKPGTLVLVAHYDAGREGSIFGRRTAFGKLLGRRIGLFEPFVWSLLLVLACTILRTAHVSGTAVSVIQFVPTVVLILSLPVLLDIALSSVVPGAIDNASGVATVLQLAERYGGRLGHFDVWVLFPGASEGLSIGMRVWMKRHRRELDPRRTLFLNLDSVGAGTIRYATREGFARTRAYHPRLVELCAQIAAEDRDEGRYRAQPIVSRSPGDGSVARAAGFPAITISCMNGPGQRPEPNHPSEIPERIDGASLERAFEFCCELIELVDERIGPDLVALPGAE